MTINNRTKQIIQKTLAEDRVGHDKTTLLFVPAKKKGRAAIVAKENGILCGIKIAEYIFKKINKKTKVKLLAKDGGRLLKNQKVMIISGNLQTILKAERACLNFLSLLSGIATSTKKFVDKAKKMNVFVKDTRKTTPGLRHLEKYAVSLGGGKNHRYNLAEGIIIKDNHLRAASVINKRKRVNQKNLKESLKDLRKKTKMPVEIEVETLKEFREVAKYKPDIIMLDNFSKKDLKKAVKYRDEYFPKIELEASGRITIKNIESVAASGIDSVSVGSITHSPKALDFSLELI